MSGNKDGNSKTPILNMNEYIKWRVKMMNHWTDSRSSEDEIDYNHIALMATSSDKNEPLKDPNHGTVKKHTLVMDSGCSRHMTGRKSLLTEFERRSGPTVSFGDGNKGEILGYDSIKLENIIIEHVSLVERLKHTLLSISQLSEKGYHALFDNTKCTITSMSSRETMLISQKHGNIYEASLSDATQGKVICLFSKASTEER